jgi:hypothetical protein
MITFKEYLVESKNISFEEAMLKEYLDFHFKNNFKHENKEKLRNIKYTFKGKSVIFKYDITMEELIPTHKNDLKKALTFFERNKLHYKSKNQAFANHEKAKVSLNAGELSKKFGEYYIEKGDYSPEIKMNISDINIPQDFAEQKREQLELDLFKESKEGAKLIKLRDSNRKKMNTIKGFLEVHKELFREGHEKNYDEYTKYFELSKNTSGKGDYNIGYTYELTSSGPHWSSDTVTVFIKRGFTDSNYYYGMTRLESYKAHTLMDSWTEGFDIINTSKPTEAELNAPSTYGHAYQTKHAIKLT